VHCLWLTLADPDPAINGQLIYSKGLIEAVRQAGVSLKVVGLARTPAGRPSPDPGLQWHVLTEAPMPKWRRVISGIPQVARRGAFPAMRMALREALAERPWDAVVFDSICAGWAFADVVQFRRISKRPLRLVYLAHNHEVTVARRIADSASGARRLLKELDAAKVVHLERRLIAEADLVTANAPEDCRTFAAEWGGRSVPFIPPGYGGPRVPSRRIDSNVPRRAVLVGSLDWPPKRIAVEKFLDVGAGLLERAGIELQVVGAVETDYLEQMRRRYPSVAFEGAVDDVRPYMAQARIALVPDLLGGFKLKGLDYVFNRLPIVAMRIALPGMPLEDGASISLCDTHTELAGEVIRLIDDFAALNARQERAFAACEDAFDWARIGRYLVQCIGQAGPPRAGGPESASRQPIREAAA